MFYSLIPGTALPSSLFMYIVELMDWARPLFQSPTFRIFCDLHSNIIVRKMFNKV